MAAPQVQVIIKGYLACSAQGLGRKDECVTPKRALWLDAHPCPVVGLALGSPGTCRLD